MAKVTLKNVTKQYETGKTVVDDVSLEIANQEFVVLVGPSGCGKSTTLRMIAGLEQISGGEIYIGDKRVNELRPKDRDIAMVFQNYALYPHMTVYDNMAFGLKLRKFPKSEIRQRVQQAAAILGIGDLLDRKPKALSGGQRQRVAVGRAIVRQPQVFLFDEPLSNLDAQLRVQMRTEIVRLHQKLRATMIYVTHDQVEAMTMGQRIVVMKDGAVQQIAAPMDLYRWPRTKFVASFIGSPAMNLIDGRLVKEDGLRFVCDGFCLNLTTAHERTLAQYVDKQVTFGIRPEDILEAESSQEGSQNGRVELAIEVVEPMGSETFLYAAAGESSLTIRLRTEKIIQAGQKMLLNFDLRRAHFFDVTSGEALI